MNFDCEAYFSLPQKLNLESYRNEISDKSTTEAENIVLSDPTNIKHKISYIQKEYNLLPIFKDQFDHLNEVLSVQRNEYLSCRWNQFLDKVPENYTRIQLYMDYKKKLQNRSVRRKTLNGKFYGEDNKLAPIPQLSDPRNLGVKHSIKKRKAIKPLK